jgi:hypothetical protein
LKDHEHPFFRPLWRRIAFTAACAAWTVLEFAADSPFWGMIALGFTGFAIWEFFYLYKEPEGPAGHDGKE